MDKLCGEYKDIFSLHQSDTGHTKLLTMNIDTGGHPPITYKPYMLPLKHRQWVCEELKMLEEARIISRNVPPWSSTMVIVPKKAHSGKTPQKHLCRNYHTLNSLLPPFVKTLSKSQGVLSLVP